MNVSTYKIVLDLKEDEEVIERNEIFVPAGKSKTSFIDVADIGFAVATLLHNANQYRNTAHTIIGPEWERLRKL